MVSNNHNLSQYATLTFTQSGEYQVSYYKANIYQTKCPANALLFKLIYLARFEFVYGGRQGAASTAAGAVGRWH
jgi:hypothetical protein